MQKMHAHFTKQTNVSGICHHMIFEKKYIQEIFEIVEKEHHKLFYHVFLQKVTHIHGSGASEYELYFNHMNLKHPDKINIRQLNWINTNNLSTLESDFDYVSYHYYMR